jgi:hypothetical protein
MRRACLSPLAANTSSMLRPAGRSLHLSRQQSPSWVSVWLVSSSFAAAGIIGNCSGPAQARQHGGQVVTAVETVFELSQVARNMLAVDGAVCGDDDRAALLFRSASGQLQSSVCFRVGSAFGGERAFVGCTVLALHAAGGAGPVRQRVSWTERLRREMRVAGAAWVADRQVYPFGSAGVRQPAGTSTKGDDHVATAYADDR